MTPLRILTVAVMTIAIYLGLGLEAVAGGRTLWPHVPAVVLIVAAWSLSAAPAVLIAAVVGLGCDVIGIGPLGPGVIAAATAVSIGTIARDCWELESPLAASLFGMALAAAFLAGPVIATSIANNAPLPVATVQLLVARAIASALAATSLILIARIAARTVKTLTGILLNV